jgi:hypothetical protein
VVALIEDRPGTFHYVVVVAWRDEGVVFHDPARAPFRVAASSDFERKWRAADRWMAVIVPAAGAPELEANRRDWSVTVTSCDRHIADGVHHAQAGDLDAAERALTAALGCPGPAATRELAGVRLLQKRWTEVADLASAAVALDATDAHAWKLLATSRFVEGDRLGALDAWNRAGEPRLDLISVEGLERTRYRVVERLLDVTPGAVVTRGGFIQATRRLGELPSAASTRLDYVPVPSGLAELRAVVVDRPLAPTGRLSLVALGAVAAGTREVRVATGSFTGGGETVSLAWRFWPDRPRVGVGLHAPAPWGGVWGVDLFTERQPFTSSMFPTASRTGGRLRLSDWGTPRVRWEFDGGVDRWQETGAFSRLGSGVRLVSLDERFEAQFGANAWLGPTRFALAGASLHLRSSAEPDGYVVLGTIAAHGATAAAPPDLWMAGDTGHARGTLLRAHPLLDAGRIRADRLGRGLFNASIEARRWRRAAGVLRVGPAAFLDAGRTGLREGAPGEWDVDAGVGLRLAARGIIPGLFRVDVARGLRDGATAVSFVYEPRGGKYKH